MNLASTVLIPDHPPLYPALCTCENMLQYSGALIWLGSLKYSDTFEYNFGIAWYSDQ